MLYFKSGVGKLFLLGLDNKYVLFAGRLSCFFGNYLITTIMQTHYNAKPAIDYMWINKYGCILMDFIYGYQNLNFIVLYVIK